jgi:uncharacterized protein (DUF934 family)
VPLLDRNGWKADAWVRAEEPIATEALLVPLAVLDAALEARAGDQKIGVEIANDMAAAALADRQDGLDLIAIGFPQFKDGRGFGIARALRAQGYRGTLRATGPLVPDQFAFALECGFDEIEIGEEQAARQPIEQWLDALTFITASYRPVRRRAA